MNDVTPERFNRIKMTTNELAESLGVSPTTITRAVKKLDAVLQPVEVNSQGGMLFDVGQATLIKQEIQKHHNLQNRQIDNVSTELEENQTISKILLKGILKNGENNRMKISTLFTCIGTTS